MKRRKKGARKKGGEKRNEEDIISGKICKVTTFFAG